MSRSWWPSGWKIGSRLRQLVPLPRPEVLAVAAVALVAFVITLSVVASSAAARSRRAAAQALEESRRAQKRPVLTTEELALGVEDFMLPALPAAGNPAAVCPVPSPACPLERRDRGEVLGAAPRYRRGDR